MLRYGNLSCFSGATLSGIANAIKQFQGGPGEEHVSSYRIVEIPVLRTALI